MAPKTCENCVHRTPAPPPPPGRHGSMENSGFALCAKGNKWTFYPPQQTCAKHVQTGEPFCEVPRGGEK